MYNYFFISQIQRYETEMTHLDQQHPHCLVSKHLSFILVTGENGTVVIVIPQSDVDSCCSDIVGRIRLSC